MIKKKNIFIIKIHPIKGYLGVMLRNSTNVIIYFFYDYLSRLGFFYQLITFFRYREVPPEMYKRKFIKKILARYKFDNAIETGAYLGQTTKVISKSVAVTTIEIDPNLNVYLKSKFRKSPVSVLHGDSAKLFQSLIKEKDYSTFFYLDSHFSGGITSQGQSVTTLKDEILGLRDFKGLNKSLILIDDVISLNGINDYPEREFIVNFASDHNLYLSTILPNSIILFGRDLPLRRVI